MKDKDLMYELSNTRMLIFLEKESLSNIYEQVLLTSEQYKKITELISIFTGNKDEYGDYEVQIITSKETYKLPDLQEIHNLSTAK